MSSKISIITINYNDKNGLQKTIASVTSQIWQDFEFIVIDGNSNDGSKDVIEANEHALTHYVSEPDSGIYNAMNKGIRLASGTYLLFLNSGDILLDQHTLQNAQEYIDDNYGIYYGDVIYQHPDKQRKRILPEKLTFLFFLEHSLSHQASFIKKDLFDKIFYYNETYKIVSDWEFFIYAICKMNVSYKHIPLFITIYDVAGISSLKDNYPLMLEERNQILCKYFPAFIDDYQSITALGSKRTKQFLFIGKHKLAWKVLKGMMNIILLFLKKKSPNKTN
jgi:glycosyltransferase involved in cell wall biosynthesis